MENLTEMNVQVIELNNDELELVNGGYWWVIPAAVFIYDAVSDFIDGWNSVQ